MKINNLCKNRRIGTLPLQTPFLLPSFSSTIFGIYNLEYAKYANLLYIDLKEKLSSTLISLFDLYYRNININDIYGPDVIFFDSGLYESRTYSNAGHNIIWNEDYFRKEINTLDSNRKSILVNFDKYSPLNEQITSASELFKRHPSFYSDFLIKPLKFGDIISVNDLQKEIRNLNNFNIIGFSENELGYSINDRCKNLIKIRELFNDFNIDAPIHIFGCLDLLNVISLFCCGGDIFDGLCWLRHSYLNYYSIHHQDFAFKKYLYSYNENDINKISHVENINYLKTIVNRMNLFLKNYNFNSFEMETDLSTSIKHLLDDVGIDLVI